MTWQPIFVYVVIAIITIFVMTLLRAEGEDDIGYIPLVGLFWPIVVPLAALVLLGIVFVGGPMQLAEYLRKKTEPKK